MALIPQFTAHAFALLRNSFDQSKEQFVRAMNYTQPYLEAVLHGDQQNLVFVTIMVVALGAAWFMSPDHKPDPFKFYCKIQERNVRYAPAVLEQSSKLTSPVKTVSIAYDTTDSDEGEDTATDGTNTPPPSSLFFKTMRPSSFIPSLYTPLPGPNFSHVIERKPPYTPKSAIDGVDHPSPFVNVARTAHPFIDAKLAYRPPTLGCQTHAVSVLSSYVGSNPSPDFAKLARLAPTSFDSLKRMGFFHEDGTPTKKMSEKLLKKKTMRTEEADVDSPLAGRNDSPIPYRNDKVPIWLR